MSPALERKLPEIQPVIGARVLLKDEWDCLVPAGWYTVSAIDESGCFYVGGHIAVWPRRIMKLEVPEGPAA